MLKSGLKKTIRKFHKKSNNKKRAIVLNTNGKYLFACGTMILNIMDKIENFDNIIVYYSDVPQEHIEALKKIDKRIICEEVTMDSLNNIFFDGESVIKYNDFIARYTYLCISKIILFQLLEKYEQVIFFDLDMIILDNLNEILDKKKYNIVWKSDNTNILSKIMMFSKVNKDIPEYDLYTKIITPNGGLFILNRNFDYNLSYKIGKDFVKRCMYHHPFLIDELTFGYIAYKNNLRVFSVNERIYNTIPAYVTSDTKLPHFYRDYKAWNSEIIQFLYPQWGKYYKKLEDITGIKSEEVKIYKDKFKLIGEERFYKTWIKLIENFKFPQDLERPLDINKQSIYFKYNRNISYFIKCNFEAKSFCTVIKIDKENLDCIANIIEQVKNTTQKYTDIKTENKENTIILTSPWCSLKDISTKFIRFYDITLGLRLISNKVFLHSLDNGYLTTFFNKYLFLCGNKLCQTNDLQMASYLQIFLAFDKIFFKINGEDLFINNIYSDGTITISNKISFFNCINNSGKLVIKINNNYLSARNDGSIRLMPHGREWEKFIFKYI